mgnify:FL=1
MLVDKAKMHDDLRLLGVAVKKRWVIPESFKQTIVERLQRIVQGQDDELALKAIGQAKSLESQNQTDEHKNLDEFSSNLIKLAARLGIDVGAICNRDEASGRAIEADGGTDAKDEG